jgi:hypothetical protein
MNETIDFYKLFTNHSLYGGRMLSGSKISPKGHKCVWNANIVTRSQGKVWFGDVDITKDGPLLKEIAGKAGEPLYVLREMDCRFETATASVDVLIGKAVWNTNEP